MPKKWVKESLHHDFLTNLFVKSVTWIKNNRENAIIGGFITLVAICFIPFIISHQANMDTEVMTLVSQGELLSAQGQYEQALSFLNQALQKNRKKTNMLAYYYKGNTLFITGRYQEAIETYNKYLENFKNKKLTPEIMIGLIKAYEQINDFNNSIVSTTSGSSWDKTCSFIFRLPSNHDLTFCPFESFSTSSFPFCG